LRVARQKENPGKKSGHSDPLHKSSQDVISQTLKATLPFFLSQQRKDIFNNSHSSSSLQSTAMKHACKTHRQTLFAFWFRSWDMDSMKKTPSFSQLDFRVK
jgi:hypothetical protein